jgi:heat-inducible transcriptional repressor
MLTDRQLLLLRVIIDDFIETAHPVGSRALAKKENVSLSAATVRNEMADLEELGFLEKTHISSGRVPSEKGYRFYVDHLIKPTIKQKNVKIIESIIKDGFYEFEQIVQMSAEILSELTNYTSIILGPEIDDTRLKQLQFVTLSPHTAVAILITNTGHVEHRSFTIPVEIDASDLEKMVNILNDRLKDVPMIRLQEVFDREVASLLKANLVHYEQASRYLQAIFTSEQPVKLYIGGKSNILLQPEFKDIDKIRSFYTMIEKEEVVADLLKNAQSGIKVSIGNENEVDEIKDLSLITASYQAGKEQMGTIALLGPTRMEYQKVISLLKGLSNEMTKTLYMHSKRDE